MKTNIQKLRERYLALRERQVGVETLTVVEETCEALLKDVEAMKRNCFCERKGDLFEKLCSECYNMEKVIIESLKEIKKGTVPRKKIAEVIIDIVDSFKNEFKEEIKQLLKEEKGCGKLIRNELSDDPERDSWQCGQYYDSFKKVLLCKKCEKPKAEDGNG